MRSSAVWIHGSSYVGVLLDAGNNQNSGCATVLLIFRWPTSTEDQVRPMWLVCGICGG